MNLLVDSANNKKYGDLNMSLINSMTHGHNRYPTSYAAIYTILCKYVPESNNNKKDSITMRDRPVKGVSFYQRAIPVDRPTAAGTNGITEYMITFCKCGHRGHRYPLFPKFNDNVSQGIQFMFAQGMHPQFAVQFTHTSWLLIDTRYTLNSIWNNQLLESVSPYSTI